MVEAQAQTHVLEYLAMMAPIDTNTVEQYNPPYLGGDAVPLRSKTSMLNNLVMCLALSAG